MDIVPPLVQQVQPDIALHMGVAAGRTYFAVEQTSQKNQYSFSPDIDGQVFEDYEGEAIWGDQPQKLSTDIDLQAVVADWQKRTSDITWPANLNEFLTNSSLVPKSRVNVQLLEDVMGVKADDVRWSDAVGSYLCAFIYYADMVQMSKVSKDKKRDVAFMHVPLLEGEEELELGVEVASALIQALVATWRAQRAVL